MTKKERAAFDKALHDARVAGALRWTDPVQPDIYPPEKGGEIVNGWQYNAYELRVEKACTSTIYHARGQWDETRSQGPLRLFSTPLLALKAMRHAIERESAEKLARIDAEITASRENESL